MASSPPIAFLSFFLPTLTLVFFVLFLQMICHDLRIAKLCKLTTIIKEQRRLLFLVPVREHF